MNEPHTPLPSLLDNATPGAQAAVQRASPLAALRDRWTALLADPARARRVRILGNTLGGVAVVTLGLATYFLARPVPQPDYLDDPVGKLLNYTLLTDEFNHLPIEKRVALVGQLVQRLKSMSTGDSAMMAAFAAGIAGSAREQLETNISRLAVDVWDHKAVEYPSVPPEQREAFLDRAFVEFEKMMEGAAGVVRNISDEQRLANVKKQAARDMAIMQDPARRPDSESIGRMMEFMNRKIGGQASAAQRARGALMLRDMARHFRGQDIATGKPKPPK